MTSSQETIRRLDDARRGVRLALDALGKIPDDDVPRVTNDGIQHELLEVDERLQALREDLSPAGKQDRSDEQE
jgi:hypothetical protein